MKHICFYCFNRYSPSEVHFRCTETNTARCPWEPDLVLGMFRGQEAAPPVLAHSFKPATRRLGGPPLAADCDVCQQETNNRLCPHCHNEIPHTVGLATDRIIGIYGAAKSGKSQYIATVIHQLERVHAPDLGIDIMAVDEATRRRYREEFYEPLWKRNECVRKTAIGRRGDVRPLIYSVRRNGQHCLNMVLYDTAGESFEQEFGDRDARYLLHTRGLVFLVDPLQIPEVRDHLTQVGHPVPEQHEAPLELIGRFITEYEKVHPEITRGHRKIPIPVAVTFTKTDALIAGEVLQPGTSLAEDSPHGDAFEAQQNERTSSEIQAWLAEWGQQALLQRVRDNFADHTYCGISSLGQPPLPDDKGDYVRLQGPPHPRRVADPILWLMAKFRIIRSRR